MSDLIDIKELKKVDVVQIIRNAKTLNEAVVAMNGLAANGHLTLWDNTTHPDGTSYRDIITNAPTVQKGEPLPLGNMANSPEHVKDYIRRQMPDISKEWVSLSDEELKKLRVGCFALFEYGKKVNDTLKQLNSEKG